MKKLSVAGYVIGAIALAGLCGGVYYKFGEAAKPPPVNTAVQPVLVTAQPVERGSVREEVTLVGNVEPLTLVNVISKVAGRIDMIGVGENDAVEAGKTVLAEIDRETYRAQLEQGRAAVQAALAAVAISETALAQIEKDYQRAERLFTEGALPERERDQARAQYDGARSQKQAAEAQLAQARAVLTLAEIQYRESQVIAPIDGVVLKKFQDKGNMTAPTAPMPLFTIGEIRQVKVTAGLSERFVGRVQEGQTDAIVCPDALPESQCSVKLAKISPIVDPLTRTAKVEVVVPNPELKLKPGMFVRLRLVLAEHRDVIVVPADAILQDSAGSCVFVLEGETARRREVQLGIRQAELQEITAGLQSGEQIIRTGTATLKDGSPVKLFQQGGGS